MTAAAPRGGHRRALLAKVHIAKKDLSLTDESYRALLQRVTKKDSAGDCGDRQLAALLSEFKRLGWTPKKRRPKRARAGRPLADQATARKMRALWLSLYHLGEVGDPSERALAAFVKRQTGRDALQWVTSLEAYKAIEALAAWCGRAGFAKPDANLWGRVNALRARERLEPIEHNFIFKALLIEAIWARLTEAGAFKHEGAALDSWLRRDWGVAAPWFLAPDQADQAIEQLGAWLRRTAGKHESQKAGKAESPPS